MIRIALFGHNPDPGAESRFEKIQRGHREINYKSLQNGHEPGAVRERLVTYVRLVMKDIWESLRDI